jgi:molybdopterin/thiamine biosynthesis adenylyltransferase
MSDAWDRVEKLLGAGALAQLAQKQVAVIGLGSGGGFVALSLAMSGVGNFLLIDDDLLETTNIPRHVADLRDVGRPKAEAVADLIRARNPQANVRAIVGRVEQHSHELAKVDLVVVGVDGELIKYKINEACRAAGLTAVYAGVYERGEGGDVVVINPNGESPCYACWASQLREDIAEITNLPDGQLDYGMIGPNGTMEAQPGLWLHVVRVAAAQADLALNVLLQGQPTHKTMPANTVILANVATEIFAGVPAAPYTAQWVQIARDENCLVCGQPRQARLSLEGLMGTMLLEADDDEENHSQQGGQA